MELRQSLPGLTNREPAQANAHGTFNDEHDRGTVPARYGCKELAGGGGGYLRLLHEFGGWFVVGAQRLREGINQLAVEQVAAQLDRLLDFVVWERCRRMIGKSQDPARLHVDQQAIQTALGVPHDFIADILSVHSRLQGSMRRSLHTTVQARLMSSNEGGGR
ncbi:MAG: hypothetical protein OXJ53_12495 [Gammaproteobacteria bacterium]|nr:hypothetical protein [Gammaproteobacteria bacterium]MDE0272504.1 hypothetical protein [Gammaproteobacteria bacterium]